MSATGHRERTGFSLIEVIVALLLMAIAAAIMVTYISHSLNRVHRPRETITSVFSIHAVMENIVDRHDVLGDLSDLSAEIGAESSAADNDFGVYQVKHNRYVDFDGANSEFTSASNALLKVSIRNEFGETLTRLFTGDP